VTTGLFCFSSLKIEILEQANGILAGQEKTAEHKGAFLAVVIVQESCALTGLRYF